MDCTDAMGGLINAEFGGMTAQQLAAIAAIIIVIVVVINLRRRRPAATDARQQSAPGVRADPRLSRDLENLMVQLDELSRTINAQVDTKFAKLEQSIADADKRIVALRTLLEYPRSEARTNAEVKQTGATPASSVQRVQSDDRFQAIYDLADQGFSPVEIGEKLGRRAGEVELILNLRGAGDRKNERGSGSAWA